ncbi:MAG: CRISPR-associated endonuclease Cas3'', partial [Halorhodospira sp.]
MSDSIVYAHSRPGRPESEWQPLAEHLNNVAAMAAGFAAAFDSAEWGRLAGLWHDLGKYSAAFQDYLRRSARDDGSARRGEVDHSTAGAKYACTQFDSASTRHIGRILSYCIAGHHGGLADWDTGNSSLRSRLQADK